MNIVICFISKSAKLISTWVKNGKFDDLLYLYIYSIIKYVWKCLYSVAVNSSTHLIAEAKK